MRDRRAYRPSVNDALEERLALSRAGAVSNLAARVSERGLPNVRNTPKALGPVGVLGDSYSDEYRFYPPHRIHARNWVEILNATRGVNFGPLTGRSRGEPRDQGFAYNWARSDATSVAMVDNQLPGLVRQVAAGKIRYAAVFIGGNDFLHLLGAVQAGVVAPTQALPALVQTTRTASTNFATAVQTLLAANADVKLVAFNLPNVAVLPTTQAQATTPQAKLFLAAVGQAIDQYNGVIAQVAATNPSRIALVDLAAVTRATAGSPTGTLSFGGKSIDLLTPGDDYHHFFLADNIHVGTVGQGIIADLFALAVDEKFGGQTFPPTPQEIVRLAVLIQRRTAGRSGTGPG